MALCFFVRADSHHIGELSFEPLSQRQRGEIHEGAQPGRHEALPGVDDMDGIRLAMPLGEDRHQSSLIAGLTTQV